MQRKIGFGGFFAKKMFTLFLILAIAGQSFAQEQIPTGKVTAIFCTFPVGQKPCAQATWMGTPICEWNTEKCALQEPAQCNEGEKKCLGGYLQECVLENETAWENKSFCQFGCNQSTLECNLMPVCTEKWQCTEWSACLSGMQSRQCLETNNCSTALQRPAFTQKCSQAFCGDNICSENESCPKDCLATPQGMLEIMIGIIIFMALTIVAVKMLKSN